jgi:ABC-type phosphate transport system ATPase subunit
MVSYRGHPLDELDPLTLRRRVGMVFQRPIQHNARLHRVEVARHGTDGS